MARLRYSAVNSGDIDINYFKTYQNYTGPEAAMVHSRHFTNLFEVPVMFYVISIFIYLENCVNIYFLSLLWSYVLLRYVHSYIHLGSNNIMKRYKVYTLSIFVLTMTWLGLFVVLLMKY